MAIKDQIITDNYSIINGDCIEVMSEMPDNKIDLSIYSPPFASMYTYSSSDQDLGNSKNYNEFLIHYEYVIKEIFRITKPGRITAIHCMDIPRNGDQGLIDFPGDIIRLHQKNGFKFWDRKNIWKEPLRIAIRTRQQCLKHGQLVKDSLKCRGALADYLLLFKKIGENKIPVNHPFGLTKYEGDLELMNEIELKEYQKLTENFVNYTDDQTNRLSQFIWRRYASSSWEDVNAKHCISYKEAKDVEDDRHVCPLQLDIIIRAIILYSNENEIVFDPFSGVGSTVYSAVKNKRKGMGVELKESYYRQSVKNLQFMTDNNETNEDEEIIESTLL
jgi:DNA modification methylase